MRTIAVIAAVLLAWPANASDINLVDGDTIRIAGETIRIVDIDAPETYRPRCERELILGLKAKVMLRSILDAAAAGPVFVERHGTDRYGRTLARIFVGDIDVGSAMIASGRAVRWRSGRKAWQARFRHWCG